MKRRRTVLISAAIATAAIAIAAITAVLGRGVRSRVPSCDKVVDEAKRIMDVFAPGGGYVFDFDGGVYDAKRENVEALFECIKDYGKY